MILSELIVIRYQEESKSISVHDVRASGFSEGNCFFSDFIFPSYNFSSKFILSDIVLDQKSLGLSVSLGLDDLFSPVFGSRRFILSPLSYRDRIFVRDSAFEVYNWVIWDGLDFGAYCGRPAGNLEVIVNLVLESLIAVPSFVTIRRFLGIFPIWLKGSFAFSVSLASFVRLFSEFGFKDLESKLRFDSYVYSVSNYTVFSSLPFRSDADFKLLYVLSDRFRLNRRVLFGVKSLVSAPLGLRERILLSYFALLSRKFSLTSIIFDPKYVLRILSPITLQSHARGILSLFLKTGYNFSSLLSGSAVFKLSFMERFLRFSDFFNCSYTNELMFSILISEVGNGVGFSIGRDFGVLFNEKVVKSKRLYEFNSLPSPSGLIISDFGECGISNLKSIDKIFGSEPVAGSYIEADGRLYRYDNFKGYIVPAKGLKFRSVKVCLYGIREAEDFIVRLITHRRR